MINLWIFFFFKRNQRTTETSEIGQIKKNKGSPFYKKICLSELESAAANLTENICLQ